MVPSCDYCSPFPAERLVQWILTQHRKHTALTSEAIFIVPNFHYARKFFLFQPDRFVFMLVLTSEDAKRVGDIILRNLLKPQGIHVHLLDPSNSTMK